ncbi:MAG: glycosyltransferase involved in cell wall biosynthesis, partial [Pseudohongiellaceae bacterium]
MKIVHLITTLDVGGAEKHLLWLGGAQVAQGHEVAVVWFKGQGSLEEEFRLAGMAVHHVDMQRIGRARAAAADLRKLLVQQHPDVLHSHLLKADALGAWVGRTAKVPVVVSSKHNDERALLKRSVGWLHGWLTRRVDRVIALSDHVAGFVAQHGHVPLEKITRIYYGVDAEALLPSRSRAEVRSELGLANNAPLLICVGRLAPQKDHPTLLKALAKLPECVTLLVVGGDPFGDGEAQLSALADELALGDRARFLGIRHDVPDLLAASDLFVLPSLWEGLGLVFLEAMAVKLPVVASNVSAIPEVIADGVSGWLVPPGEPQALADALENALSNDTDRLARGLAGHMRLL